MSSLARLARLALFVLVVPVVLAGASLPAAARAGTVVFGPGDATSVQDGRTVCVIGTSKRGVGSAVCGGKSVYDALWAGTPCDSMTRMGCVVDGRIRAVRLRETGKPQRAWIDGLGGVLDVERGQKIKAGRITGQRLPDGGFRFANPAGHAFRVTNTALAVR